MLVQALHLVDNGAELIRAHARHVILLICTQKHSRANIPKIKPSQLPKQRSEI